VNNPVRLSVLGGAGFVGRALLQRAEQMQLASDHVRVLVRGAAPTSSLRAQLVIGELGPRPLPDDLFFEQPHVVVHLATKQIDRDGSGFDQNVEHARQLMANIGHSCRGVIYGSSASVYGRGPLQGVSEQAAERPDTALARSRRAAEQVIMEAARARGIDAYVLRPRFLVGQGDRFFLPGLRRLFQRGIGLGTGRQELTVIDVADYAEIILWLARMMIDADQPTVRALNVGYRSPVRLSELAGALDATPKLWLPVPQRALFALRSVGSTRATALAGKLELIAQSHVLDVGALAELASRVGVRGAALVARDPRLVLARAAAQL
jgi:nucleoside-diphosphate-sugar epimerase